MRVLLVHGLGRTPASLGSLHRSLRRAGHTPQSFGYFAFAQSYEEIRLRLVLRLRRLAMVPTPVALLGHSLGGLLLRHALADVPDLAVHRLIMLGTPNRPPRRARLAVRWLPFRLLTRSCGTFLASSQAFDQIAPIRVPYTLIAGTGGARWLGRPFREEPHDGFVAVSENLIGDADRPITLPVGHTFMMNDPALQRIVLDLLDRRVPAEPDRPPGAIPPG
jgi:pimeloyl-ACP methyl ester carboxylesterase